ncbi:hypothetical protein C0993_004922 [Termitomyces sp. T159_Od127]|nr:hypothetical protein C0993_004922 [Termitomyces sp. T159_Od127]
MHIPGTYAGILACHALEVALPAIHMNVILIFGLVQAQTCAQACMVVVSPFVGHVKDWCDVHTTDPSSQHVPVHPYAHPGLVLLHMIHMAFNVHGYTMHTAVMAARFHAADEVVWAATACPDVVTLQLALLRELTAHGVGFDFIKNADANADATASAGAEPQYIMCGNGEDGMGSKKEEVEVEVLFVWDLEEKHIAVEKVPEGLAKFAVDATRLEDLLHEKIQTSMK